MNKTILSHFPAGAWTRLRDILNVALSAGYFPDRFSEAMRMLVKPGKAPACPDSYKPISLLEVPRNLFERILTRRLRNHLEWDGHYNSTQYGFRRRKNTVHATGLAWRGLPSTSHPDLDAT